MQQAGVKYANDTSMLGLKMSAVLDGAENHKPEAPARVTSQRLSQGNRIIAANNPIWQTDLPGLDPGPSSHGRQSIRGAIEGFEPSGST